MVLATVSVTTSSPNIGNRYCLGEARAEWEGEGRLGREDFDFFFSIYDLCHDLLVTLLPTLII